MDFRAYDHLDSELADSLGKLLPQYSHIQEIGRNDGKLFITITFLGLVPMLKSKLQGLTKCVGAEFAISVEKNYTKAHLFMTEDSRKKIIILGNLS